MRFLNVFAHQTVPEAAINRMFTLLEQTLRNLAKLLSGNIGPDNISDEYTQVNRIWFGA